VFTTSGPSSGDIFPATDTLERQSAAAAAAVVVAVVSIVIVIDTRVGRPFDQSTARGPDGRFSHGATRVAVRAPRRLRAAEGSSY